MKKYTLAILLSATTVAICNPIMAANGGGSTSVLSALETFIGGTGEPHSLKHFLTEHWNGADPNTIPNIATLTALNTTKIAVPPFTLPGQKNTQQKNADLSLGSIAAAVAQRETSENLYNTLSQFPYAMYSNNQTTLANIADLKPAGTKDLSPTSTNKNPTFTDYMNENSLSRLSTNTHASDTLYLAGTTAELNAGSSQPAQLKPKTLNNDYLNFANLITPITYTPSQAVGANQFLKYAAKSTQNLTEGVNLDKLYNKKAALNALVADDTYQKYVVTIRSILAIRSISINTLNQLIAERTPVAGLEKTITPAITAENNAIKLYNASNNSQTPLPQIPVPQPDSVSPLQVEQFQATHDIENPAWYNTVANYPAATVQREILITLKEIQRQNFQAHLDSERLLAAITAQNLLSNSQQISQTLEQETQDINNAIDSALGEKPKNTVPSGKEAVESAAGGPASPKSNGGTTEAPGEQ